MSLEEQFDLHEFLTEWSDYKIQFNDKYIDLIYPDYTSTDEFKSSQMKKLIFKATLRLMNFFGYKVTENLNVVQIKPILRKDGYNIIGLCNPENLNKITHILNFLKNNNMDTLSALFCLMICMALKDSESFRELVKDKKLLSKWLKTQKYITKEQRRKICSELTTSEQKSEREVEDAEQVEREVEKDVEAVEKDVEKDVEADEEVEKDDEEVEKDAKKKRKAEKKALKQAEKEKAQREKARADIEKAQREKAQREKTQREKAKERENTKEKVEKKDENSFDCNICASTRNNSQKVICPKCKFECCKSCVKKYLLDSSKLNPTCMSCQTDWNLGFIYSMDSNFYGKDYRIHRANVLLSMEKSLLPTTQNEARVELEKREKKMKSLALHKVLFEEKRLLDIYYNDFTANKSKENSRKFRDIYAKQSDRISVLQRELDILDGKVRPMDIQFNQVMEIPEEKRTPEQIEFIQLYIQQYGNRMHENTKKKAYSNTVTGPCPYNGCKGFLNAEFTCGLCQRKACQHCRLPEHDDKCDPNIVETVKMMDRETRRCPKCNVPIYKTEGCDQMWCPSCHTAFSWNTGEIEKGRIHNPHYYKWAREKGGGQMAREPGDERCGGIVSYGVLLLKLRELHAEKYEVFIGNIHALVGHIRHSMLVLMQDSNAPDQNKDLRISYLLGDITQEKWMSEIKRREKATEKRREERLVLEMLACTLENILDNISTVQSQKELEGYLQEIEGLQNYVNEEFDKIAKRFQNKTFHLDNWVFNKHRIINVNRRVTPGRGVTPARRL